MRSLYRIWEFQAVKVVVLWF